MFGLEFITEIWLETFLLVFIRFAGWVIVSPVFGRKNIPGMLRVAFGLIMTMITVFTLPLPEKVLSESFIEFFGYGVREMMFGMIMGFVSLVIFQLGIAAGQLIDMQIGFGMSSLFDPQFGVQVPLSGNLLNIIIMLIFFTVNGHHMLIWIMHSSFEAIPVGQVVFGAKLFEYIVSYFIWFFILAVKITFPIIAVAVIIEVSLGIVMKTMPQMNMFVVGIPLKLVVGIFSLILFLSVFVLVIENGLDRMFF
jgi:flagellar biosynthetic protein FliR